MSSFPEIILHGPDAEGECALEFLPNTSTARAALFLKKHPASGETIAHQVISLWLEEYKKAQPGWRPIDTAPKDGTTVLVANDKYVAEGSFFTGYWSWGMPIADEIQPTHWMPLPPPPTEGASHE